MRPVLSLLLLVISLWLDAGVVVRAQSTREIARATSIEHAAWLGIAHDELLYQSGFSLRVTSLRPKVASKATLGLPLSTAIYDYSENGGKLLVVAVGSEGVFATLAAGRDSAGAAKWHRVSDATDLFRQRLDAAPKRQQFITRRGAAFQIAVPGLTGLRILNLSADAEKAEEAGFVEAPVESEQSLGWGLGYRMRVKILPPAFFAFPESSEKAAAWLFRKGAEWRLFQGRAEPVLWSAAPAKEDHRILDFDRPISPKLRDFDQDGIPDLLGCDPGTGTLFVSRGAGRGEKSGNAKVQPDQVIRVGGWLLSRWLVDADGDGREDLVTASIPELNILEQIAVLKNKSAPFRFAVRRQNESGSFSDSPELTMKGKIAVDIVITRSRREIQFRDPLRVFRDAQGFGLIAPDDEGVALFRPENGAWAARGRLELGQREDEICLDPFGESHGADNRLLLRFTRGGALDRLVLLCL